MEAENTLVVENEAVEESWGGEDVFLEPTYAETLKELGLDGSKYGLDQEKVEVEASKEEPQGSGEAQAAGQTTDENAYLEWVNSLGAVHNDVPVKVESIDEVKNALQMFKDYTLKTQTLSEERKGWDSEKSAAEKEMNVAIENLNTSIKQHAEQLQEIQQWTFALNQLKENAPDVFEEVQRSYEGVKNQFSNPILNQQLEAQNRRFEELEQRLASREHKVIVDSFETEKSALSATEQSMKELGVTVNWDEVKKEWASTGLPLKQVLGMKYFENVTKAQASKSKVETTKQKVAARPVGAASGSRPGNKVPAINRKLDYYAQAREYMNNLK